MKFDQERLLEVTDFPHAQPDETPNEHPLGFMWLEITSKCNLLCSHCYADSAPSGNHGSMTRADWERVINEARQMGAHTIQFIGGEPTLHPNFVDLVRYTASLGLGIEVFTNLIRIEPSAWEIFQECNVSIATSFYSYIPEFQDSITMRPGSQSQTLKNIKVALSLSLPLRVGLISVLPEQDIEKTEEMLKEIGVSDVGMDHVRGIGRGLAYDKPARPVDALCGACAFSRAAIDPQGWVYPCVFSRWLKVGNVRENSLRDIVLGEQMHDVRDSLESDFSAAQKLLSPSQSCRPYCEPETCNPMCLPRDGCRPNCPPSCSPSCFPTGCTPKNCWPQFK